VARVRWTEGVVAIFHVFFSHVYLKFQFNLVLVLRAHTHTHTHTYVGQRLKVDYINFRLVAILFAVFVIVGACLLVCFCNFGKWVFTVTCISTCIVYNVYSLFHMAPNF